MSRREVSRIMGIGDTFCATRDFATSSTPIGCICSRESFELFFTDEGRMNKLLVPHFRDPDDIIGKDEVK